MKQVVRLFHGVLHSAGIQPCFSCYSEHSRVGRLASSRPQGVPLLKAESETPSQTAWTYVLYGLASSTGEIDYANYWKSPEGYCHLVAFIFGPLEWFTGAVWSKIPDPLRRISLCTVLNTIWMEECWGTKPVLLFLHHYFKADFTPSIGTLLHVSEYQTHKMVWWNDLTWL